MPPKSHAQNLTIAQVKTTIEEKIGAPVSIERADWATLMRQGVVVRLHLRRWRAKTQITLADLGLPQPKNGDEEKIYDELMALGVKRLLPADIIRLLDSIDTGARKCLTQNSFQTYWGDFVPLGKWDEWKLLNEEFKARYLAVRDDIHKRWNSIMRDLLDAYAIAARVAYKRLGRLNAKTLIVDGQRLTEDQFVDAFMSRIKDVIPEREEVYASFAYETEFSFIPLPSLLAQDSVEKERIEAKSEITRVRERTTLLKAEQEADLLRQAKWDREAALRRMTDEVLAEARQKQTQMVEGFMNDLQTQTQSALYEGLTNVLKSMQKNQGALVGRAAEQARGVLESFRAMNLVGNDKIEEQITRAENLVNREPKKRDAKEIENLLVEIANQARGNLIALGAAPQRLARAKLAPAPVAPIKERTTNRALPKATNLQLPNIRAPIRASRTMK